MGKAWMEGGNRLKPFDIAEIEWIDSEAEVGWNDCRVEEKPSIHKSVGYYWGMNDDYIFLVGDYGCGLTNRRIKIPLGCIKKKRVVK